jgi:DNA-binding NarL/FixJ family response regulator
MVIDDHALLGDAIVGVLHREGFHANAVAPNSLAGVVERVVHLAPTIALVDLDLGSTDFDGLDLIQVLQDLGVQVIALLSGDEPVLVAASMEAGASAVVSKSEPIAVLLDAVKAAARGQLVADLAERDELRRLLRELRGSHAERLAPFMRLTPRERDVLAHLVSGRSAESIATASFVSLATVRSQIRAVLTKLGVHSQLGAVAAARTSGWTGGDDTPLARFSATLSL